MEQLTPSSHPTWMVVAVVLLTWAGPCQGVSSSEEVVDLVARSYWAWKMRQFPTIAPIYKFKLVSGEQLENYSLNAVDERHEFAQNLLRALEGVNVTELQDEHEVTYDVLKADLDHYIEGYKYRLYGFLNPINFLEGVHKRTNWVNYQPLVNEQDCNRLLRRLEAVSKQFDDVTVLLSEAVRLNRTNHKYSMVGVVDNLDRLCNQTANETAYYKPFRKRNLLLNMPVWINFVQRGTHIIENSIQPALKRLRDYIANVYLNSTRPHIGVGSLEGGTDYYQACLRFHLTDDVTAEDIRDIGLREVARIRGLLEEIMKREGFAGQLSDFYTHLRVNRRREFYNKTRDELLETYHDMINNVIEPKLQYVIKNIPDDPVIVTPMPFDGPTGSYGGNTFYVNLRRPHTRPSFTMMALALHESNPGHHLQVAYAREQRLPQFRRHLCCMRYNAVPLTFQWYPAYTEGWGLYSEFLGEEMGCYNKSALELFGRYSFEIFRACRLVVDTGIHVFGWSRDQAIEYITNHTAISKSQVEKEVNRYITWPGQACAYKYGELGILRLRRQAEQVLGDKFDVREFNEQVLRVSRVPLKVLEKHIHRWLVRAKAGTAGASTSATTRISAGLLTLTTLAVSVQCLRLR